MAYTARDLDEQQQTAVDEKLWSSEERRSWTITLFFGLLLVFMSRTVGPVTLVALAREFGWDKTNQVQFPS